jgi:hypothetical protein
MGNYTAVELAEIRRQQLTGAAPRAHRDRSRRAAGRRLHKPMERFQTWLAAGQL